MTAGTSANVDCSTRTVRRMPARSATLETMDCVSASASTPRRRSEDAWPLAHATLSAKAITPDTQIGRIQPSNSLKETARDLSKVASGTAPVRLAEKTVLEESVPPRNAWYEIQP